MRRELGRVRKSLEAALAALERLEGELEFREQDVPQPPADPVCEFYTHEDTAERADALAATGLRKPRAAAAKVGLLRHRIADLDRMHLRKITSGWALYAHLSDRQYVLTGEDYDLSWEQVAMLTRLVCEELSQHGDFELHVHGRAEAVRVSAETEWCAGLR